MSKNTPTTATATTNSAAAGSGKNPLRSIGKFIMNSPMPFIVLVIGGINGILWHAGYANIATWIFLALTAYAVIDALMGIVRDIRHGHVGVDILAIIAILATTVVGEYWAAWIVVLMIYSGDAIEDFAQSRASRNLTALMDAAPQIAHVLHKSHADNAPTTIFATPDVAAADAATLSRRSSVGRPNAGDESRDPLTGEVIDYSDDDLIDPPPQSGAAEEMNDRCYILPSAAHEDGWDTVPVEKVRVNDRLVVKPGETVPVNGVLLSDQATIDLSMINGEPVPVDVYRGGRIASGAINGSSTLTMQATATAASSQYQKILQLVKTAQESRASVVKTADMLAVPFTVISLVIAFLAWYMSGDPLRFAQVLVLATPCPLLIAAPVAYMGGTGRLAKIGVIIKTQDVLENLGNVSHIFFDKTGTLTRKRPEVSAVDVLPDVADRFDRDEVLRLAGPLEAYSVHILAKGIMMAATNLIRDKHLDRPKVDNAREDSGNGVMGHVDGHKVKVGRLAFVTQKANTSAGAAPFAAPAPMSSVSPAQADGLGSGTGVGNADDGAGTGSAGAGAGSASELFAPLAPNEMVAYVSIDDELAGRIVLRDFARSNSGLAVRRLRDMGVRRLSMLTGDNNASATAIGDEVGISDIHAQLLPEDKVDVLKQARHDPLAHQSGVRRLLRHLVGAPEPTAITMMVGDGVNDAPVLASADIGVAMTDGSSTAASESAQVVIMNDDIEMVPSAITISRQTKRTMLQAVLAGLGLAIVLMVCAAFNLIPVVVGAFLQEVIDVLSILWGLTAIIDRK